MNFLFIFLIRLYQKFLSPLLPGSCRFYPSCSQYAVESFQHYGFFKAFFKSSWRILRCNPFSDGYFDPPVPEGESPEGNSQASHVHTSACLSSSEGKLDPQ